MEAFFETRDEGGVLRFEVNPEGVAASLTGDSVAIDMDQLDRLVEFLNGNLEPRQVPSD
jgi:hypothetical protein